MTADGSWQLGRPGSAIYRLYDAMRGWLSRRLVGYLAEKALSQAGCRVLEAGSGPASASSLIARLPQVRLSVAADIDPAALREARQRDPALHVVVADLYHLPFQSNSLHLTWNSSTLEHLDAPERALVEMRRVTRQEGHVFVGVPYRYGPLGWQRWVAKTPVGVWIGMVFDRAELGDRMRAAGLEPIDALCYFFRFFVGVLAKPARIRTK
jgi:SAM-dependent methyltransferase